MPRAAGSETQSNPFLAKTYTTDLIRELIFRIGDDPARSGLLKTPHRVYKAFGELFSGYEYNDQKIADMMTVFNVPKSDEMVVERNIPFHSMCEHHMLPFLGTATVAYIPKDGRVIGISKMARLVDVFARRLTMQEVITAEVADSMMRHLKPKGAACLLKAQHLCMSCRGVNKAGAETVTCSLRGCFHDDSQTRGEFMQLAGK